MRKKIIFLITFFLLVIIGARFFLLEQGRRSRQREQPDQIFHQTQTENNLQFKIREDKGIRALGSSPFVFRQNDGQIGLFYCGQGVKAAFSNNGLDFAEEISLGIDGCDPTLVKTSEGKFRLYYKVQTGADGPGGAVHKIFSALSSDGIHFQKEGVRIDSERTDDRGWASVPEAVRLTDGRVRLYYVSGATETEGGIASAISVDGLSFSKEKGARLKGNFADPALTTLPDGRFLLLVAHHCKPEKGPCGDLKNGLYFSVSPDGLNFSQLQLLYESDDCFDPSVLPLGKKEYRVYYAQMGQPGEEMAIKSFLARLE